MDRLSPPAQSFSRISAHDRAIANDALQEQDQPPTKKRRMGERNVESTGAGSSSQIPRLQLDQSAIPPLKLRRFNNDRSVVNPSFSPSDRSGPASMEAEPSTSQSESPRPVAVVRPVTVQSIIPGTAIRYKVTMDHFIPDHHNQLLDLFDSQLYPLEIVEAATQLLEICQSRGIKVKPTLFGMLKFHEIDQGHQDLLVFFEKATVFFSAVKTDIIKDTSCLTSMLNRSRPRTRQLIKIFIKQPDESVKAVAGSQYLKQFSSMFNGKGLPKKEDVEAFVGWDCWKMNSQFSLELLRAFSSMFNGKGLPKKEEVEAFVVWDCLKVSGQFSLGLLRAFSSMFNGKGLPKKEDVEAFVGWGCWKVDSHFSLELLRAFSSMFHCKGLPKKEDVEAFVGWDCWKVDGQFSLELLRAFSSIFHCKGLPKKGDVEAFVGWDCWKLNGQFSLELLRAFSSMFCGRGLSKKEDVEAFVGWDCWKVNGQFRLELLRAFSSMFHCKGLPKKWDVEAFMGWDCWKVNGQFRLELLRAFSSMMGSKGLPKKKNVEAFVGWDCWKVNGQFRLELLRAFSSMFCGRGLPEKEDVEAFAGWDCWTVNGQFRLALLRVVTSMFKGKGLPKKEAVEAFVGWDCWKVNGQFRLELLRAFSSMFNGKGLPKKEDVEAFVGWLPKDEDKQYLKLACRIFASSGLPDVAVLNQYKKQLTNKLSEKAGQSDIPHDADVKPIALFCAGPAKWKLNIKHFDGYIEGHKKSERSSLKLLQVILVNHGGKGVRCWLEMYKKNPARKQAITVALSIPAPLDRARFAIGELPEKQWKEYIELCKNLSPAPTKEQWQSLESLRETLDKKLKFTKAKRQMMEILWPLNKSDRARYGNRMDDLLNTVPTTAALHSIHRMLGIAKMKTFLYACLEYRDSLSSADKPGKESVALLMEGLLVAKLPLYDHKDIPELCFSERTSSADGKGVLIKGQTPDGGGERLGHFIAAMLDALYAMEYGFKSQQLTIEPYDGAALSLPKPEFAIAGAGFLINNWTGQQLGDFQKATEFTETWYQQPHDKRELSAKRRDKRLEQMKHRAGKTPEKAASKPRPLLTPGVIHQLIKNKIPLKPKVWESLAHYASNNQLPVILCKALQPIIQESGEGVVPDVVRSCVSTTIQKAEPVTVLIPSPRSVLTTCTPVGIMQRPEVALEGLWQQLQSTTVLEEADLELLEIHRQQMTFEQLQSVTQKISCRCEVKMLLDWHLALESKREELPEENPFGLELADIDFDLLISGGNDHRIENSMESFFTDSTEG